MSVVFCDKVQELAYSYSIRILIYCGRHVIRKAIWRILKLEIWNLKSAVSALCGCLSFACFEKKWGKVSWIFQNSSIRLITNTFSYDMPTTLDYDVPKPILYNWCLLRYTLLHKCGHIKVKLRRVRSWPLSMCRFGLLELGSGALVSIGL